MNSFSSINFISLNTSCSFLDNIKWSIESPKFVIILKKRTIAFGFPDSSRALQLYFMKIESIISNQDISTIHTSDEFMSWFPWNSNIGKKSWFRNEFRLQEEWLFWCDKFNLSCLRSVEIPHKKLSKFLKLIEFLTVCTQDSVTIRIRMDDKDEYVVKGK